MDRIYSAKWKHFQKGPKESGLLWQTSVRWGRVHSCISPLNGGSSVWLSWPLGTGDSDSWTLLFLTIPALCQPATSMFSPVGFCTFLCKWFSFWFLQLLCAFWAVLMLSILFTPVSFNRCFLCFFLSSLSLCGIDLSHWGCPVVLGVEVLKPVVGLGRALRQRLHREQVYKWQLFHCSSVWQRVISRMFCVMLEWQDPFETWIFKYFQRHCSMLITEHKVCDATLDQRCSASHLYL